EEAKRHGGVISGKAVFDLYTTHGFPPDLTRQMAAEEQLTIDQDEYDRLWKEFTTQDPVKTAVQVGINLSGGLPTTEDRPKWSGPSVEGIVLGWIADNSFHASGRLPETEVGLITERTSFYGEQGGQIGDQGTIRTPTGLFEVTQTVKVG